MPASNCKSFLPCYGLAESTLLGAGPDYRQEPTYPASQSRGAGQASRRAWRVVSQTP